MYQKNLGRSNLIDIFKCIYSRGWVLCDDQIRDKKTNRNAWYKTQTHDTSDAHPHTLTNK